MPIDPNIQMEMAHPNRGTPSTPISAPADPASDGYTLPTEPEEQTEE